MTNRFTPPRTPRLLGITRFVTQRFAMPPDRAHYGLVKSSRIVALLGVALASSASPARAQEMTGFPAVDSAAVARAAWGRAATALTATRRRRRPARGDARGGVVADSAVVSCGPRPSSRRGRAIRWRRFARFKRTPALVSDAIFAVKVRSRRSSRCPRSPRRWRRTTRIAHLSREAVKSRDSPTRPSGRKASTTIARTRRYYVASVRHRTIAEISPDGSTRELWPRDGAVVGAMFGVRVDTARGALWATTSAVPQMANYGPADSTIAALLRIRIGDGTIERRWNIPPAPDGHTLGDLAVGPNGDVFVTDSNEPVLYWLRPGADTLESIRSPLFRSLQGIAPTPDGRLLYVADYSHGILRVNLATKSVMRVADAPGSTSLGCDGIAWDRGAIVAVQNGVAPARSRALRARIRRAIDSREARVARSELGGRRRADHRYDRRTSRSSTSRTASGKSTTRRCGVSPASRSPGLACSPFPFHDRTHATASKYAHCSLLCRRGRDVVQPCATGDRRSSASYGTGPRRILFIGNSLTAANQMPALLRRAGGIGESVAAADGRPRLASGFRADRPLVDRRAAAADHEAASTPWWCCSKGRRRSR